MRWVCCEVCARVKERTLAVCVTAHCEEAAMCANCPFRPSFLPNEELKYKQARGFPRHPKALRLVRVCVRWCKCLRAVHVCGMAHFARSALACSANCARPVHAFSGISVMLSDQRPCSRSLSLSLS